MHILDLLYLPFIISRRLFTGGWGDESAIDALGAVPQIPVEDIAVPKIQWKPPVVMGDAVVEQGSFHSLDLGLPVPPETRTCYIELISPRSDGHQRQHKRSLVIHFPASGEQGFQRRRVRLAFPLVREGICSLLLESPFYGLRRPSYQKGVQIKTVSDMLLLGKLSMEEGRMLVAWAHAHGYDPIAISGTSRGGLAAAVVAAITPLPLAVAACVSGHSGEPVFTEGIIRHSCDWKSLTAQLQASEKFRHRTPEERLREILRKTDVRLFPQPLRPDAAIFIAARNDGIVPMDSALALSQSWPGSEIRWIPGGHVSSFVFHQHSLRAAIVEALARVGR